jgi:hypothetical protein
MGGLTPEQQEQALNYVQELRLSSSGVPTAGAGATAAGATGAATSSQDALRAIVAGRKNASGLAAGVNSGLGKRAAESTFEPFLTMAATEPGARMAAMFDGSSAAAKLEREMERVPKTGQPALKTAISIKGLLPTIVSASMLAMETIAVDEDLSDATKEHLLDTLAVGVAEPILQIDDLVEKYLKFVHFGYMHVVGGTPNPNIAQAMFDGKQHSTLATVTKTDEREYAQCVAAAALQSKKEPGLNKVRKDNTRNRGVGGGGSGGGGGSATKKRRDECDHCGSWDHSKRDCPWHRLSPREAKAKSLAARSDKKGYGEDRDRRY